MYCALDYTLDRCIQNKFGQRITNLQDILIILISVSLNNIMLLDNNDTISSTSFNLKLGILN